MLTFGSLFAGIGGIDLGLERAGMTCAFQVEIDDYATRVLTKHWPNVPKHRDVRSVSAHNLPRVDVLAGGFPCQPHAVQGLRKAAADQRDLWGEYYRLICELTPRWVLGENVPGLLSSDDGRFFGNILRDLAHIGYDAEWHSIRASDVGAPHRRERVFLIAYPRGERIQRIWTQQVSRVEAFSWCEDVRGVADLRNRSDLPEPLVWGNRNGVPHFVDRLRGLGNAVVPQVAEFVGNLIVAHNARYASA